MKKLVTFSVVSAMLCSNLALAQYPQRDSAQTNHPGGDHRHGQPGPQPQRGPAPSYRPAPQPMHPRTVPQHYAPAQVAGPARPNVQRYVPVQPQPRYRGHDRGHHHSWDGHRGHWYRGDRLPLTYRSPQYVVSNWYAHGLQAPPYGYQWVQVGPDYVLAAIATGIIVQMLLGH